MHRIARGLTLALLGAALTGGAAAAQATPESRIEAAKRRAAAAGIPASLLESRVAEGRAKGVPMARIAAVVERRAGALLGAREAMTGARRIGEADLAAGADALEAGIDGNALRALIGEAREEDRPVAIAVLTYLHREGGLPVDQALARVREAMGRGSDALRTLPAQARGKGAAQGPPEGVGNRGRGRPGGPPAAVPTPGTRPGSGKPDKPPKGGPPPGKGKPGG